MADLPTHNVEENLNFYLDISPIMGKNRMVMKVAKKISEKLSPSPTDEMVKPMWELVEEISAAVPDTEWAEIPTDLSKNLDHYLYASKGKVKRTRL